MKVRMLVGLGKIKAGEIVNAKYFGNLNQREKEAMDCNPKAFDQMDIFIDDDFTGCCTRYMCDDEVEIIQGSKLQVADSRMIKQPCDYCDNLKNLTPTSPRKNYKFCPMCGRELEGK